MTAATISFLRVLLPAIVAMMATVAQAQLDVVTEGWNDAWPGVNLQETLLDTSSVRLDNFGKLWSYTVSGSVIRNRCMCATWRFRNTVRTTCFTSSP